MIDREAFGRTDHISSRVIFGSYALSQVNQAEADEILKLLLEYGINHIDTAPMYGNAEIRIGPWMEKHRDDFFIATKTRSRTYQGAWKNLERSLVQLRIDHVDLWQMHGLTNPQGWEKVMSPGGTLDAFLEARSKGLARYLGVTGHGLKAPGMHIRSLERFDFDSVMLPYNYSLMQNPRYTNDFEMLAKLCRERGVALQTIKSVARRPWAGRPKIHNTYFYEPLVEQDALDNAVHWAMGLPDTFTITAGDMNILPWELEAASRFDGRPGDTEMDALLEKYDVHPVFS
jgi:aryl-alcohol dehydrogenase-like predicted oxidoreductase